MFACFCVSRCGEVALALCSLMFVRFRDAGHWAHSQSFVKDMDAKVSQADRGEARFFLQSSLSLGGLPNAT